MVQRVERGVKRGQGGEGKREEGEILYIYTYTPPGEFQSRWRGETS